MAPFSRLWNGSVEAVGICPKVTQRVWSRAGQKLVKGGKASQAEGTEKGKTPGFPRAHSASGYNIGGGVEQWREDTGG